MSTNDGPETQPAEARVSVQTLAEQWNARFHILTLSVKVAVTVPDTKG
jgi:hypothetical protein